LRTSITENIAIADGVLLDGKISIVVGVGILEDCDQHISNVLKELLMGTLSMLKVFYSIYELE
jgi:hypothetical protein